MLALFGVSVLISDISGHQTDNPGASFSANSPTWPSTGMSVPRPRTRPSAAYSFSIARSSVETPVSWGRSSSPCRPACHGESGVRCSMPRRTRSLGTASLTRTEPRGRALYKKLSQRMQGNLERNSYEKRAERAGARGRKSKEVKRLDAAAKAAHERAWASWEHRQGNAPMRATG